MFDYSFMDKHVDISNIGQHDLDNYFVHGEFMCWQFPTWQKTHPGCVPIGICKESTNCDGMFVAMVFEDSNGGRYYTHVPACWEAEAPVANEGWEACQKAQREWWNKQKP